MSGRVSIIIPTLNEAVALPRTLAHVTAQEGTWELIIVDGGSVDGTCEIAEANPRARLVRSGKGRAVQMNTGAAVSRGDWLLFLHADTLLPAGAIEVLNQLTDQGAIQSGAFSHRFDAKDWRLRAVSAAHNFKCRCTGIYYGDQAMFVRKPLFERLGGFPSVPMLEDVRLSQALRKHGRPLLLEQHVLTDARRFLALGIFRSVSQALMIMLRDSLGLPPRGEGFRREIR